MSQIESRDPPRIKEQLQQFSAQLGIQLPETLADLGTKWTFFSHQGQGGWPALAFTVDVRDKQRLLEVERQLKAKLLGPGGEIPSVARVTQTQIGGQPASTLTFQAPQMAMVSPTWCITEKHVIVATSPQVVQMVMASHMSSLADKPEVSARLIGSSGPLMLTY
jgi:hypothetical protein